MSQIRENAPSFFEMRFDSIQALRGITCLLIIFEHIRFLNCGAFGVDIFFCISGFMIMFSTHKGQNYFLRKRLIRILPLYYLMTIGSYMLLLLFPGMFHQTTANPVYLIKSLLFLPFDIGDGIIQPVLRIGWTLNCEMFFYLLFFVAMKISHQLRGILVSVFLIALTLAGAFVELSYAPMKLFAAPVMLDFVLGILLYWICYQIYQKKDRLNSKAFVAYGYLVYGAGILLVLAFTRKTVNLDGFYRVLKWGIPTALVVLAFFLYGMYQTFPRWLVRLGNISFSVYLLHYLPIQFLDRKIFGFETLTPRSAIGLIVAVAISIALGAVSWYLIEQKFTKYLFRKFLCR